MTVWDLGRLGWCGPRRTRPDQLGRAEPGRGLSPATEARERGLGFLVGGIGEQVTISAEGDNLTLIIQHGNRYP